MAQDGKGSGSKSQDPEVRVIEARIEMLFSAFSEIKTILKSLEETVAIFKVFDIQIKTLGDDQEKVEQTIRDMQLSAAETSRKITDSITHLKKDLEGDIEDAAKTAKEVQGSLQTKVAYVQGAIAAVTLFGALLYAIIVWQGGKYVDELEQADKYIHTLQTLNAEEHLRGSMSDANKAPHPEAAPQEITTRPSKL